MKKQMGGTLLAVTALFAVFTLGFFLGRNQQRQPLTVQVSSALLTEPAPTVQTEPPAQATETISFPININTAGEKELIALPGIGEVLAARILAYRDAHGDFTAPEGLMHVEGIGEKKVEEIMDLITIGGTQ